MASADYLLCLECGRKAVYDADWYDRVDPDQGGVDGEGWKGQIEALCVGCAATVELISKPRAGTKGADRVNMENRAANIRWVEYNERAKT